MRSRKPFLIFWRQYFDKKLTRSEGRRLPKNLAIDKVSIKDIAKAANQLGYQVQIEPQLHILEDGGKKVLRSLWWGELSHRIIKVPSGFCQ